MASLLRNGRNVEEIYIKHFEIGEAAMAALAAGLVDNATPKKLSFRNNKCVEDHGQTDVKSATFYLAEGLGANKTLEYLEVTTRLMGDSALGGLIQSLAGHPALRSLYLNSCRFGSETVKSVARVLAHDNCHLENLEMKGTTLDAVLDIDLFAPTLSANSNLTSLSLNGFTSVREGGINSLLQNIWKLPKLRSLDVSANGLSEKFLEGLARNLKKSSPPSRLRILNLNRGGFISESFEDGMDERHPESVAVLRILDVFPELGYLGDQFDCAIHKDKFPPDVVHRLDQNHCQGFLLRGGTIPISVWPTVIAKANKYLTGKDGRFATIAYEILQRPAFVGRDTLHTLPSES